MAKFRRVFRTFSALVLAAFAVSMAAAPAAAETRVYDWPDDEMPVVVQNDDGLIFLSKQKKPWRAYAWDQENAGEGFDTVYLVDLDKDGSPEVVGAGEPMFLLQSNSDPMWLLEEGCKQTIIADFVTNDKLDIVCNDGRKLRAYTYDGQFAWELSLGKRIEACRVGDHSGDLKADLECKYRGSNKWARIDSSGKVLTKSTDTPEIPEGGADLDLVAPADSKSSAKIVPAGVELDGKALAALAKDLDGDGKNEIVAVTEKSIYVMSEDGKEVKKYPASADDYTRKPLAKLNNVYANHFADDKKAGEVVKGLQDSLSKCYASRVRANQFAGTGLLILKVQVDHKGETTDVSTVHSGINDSKIEKCAQKALKRGDYPKAESEKTPATINVNMEYTFWDE
jgi:hypothetical protein